MIRKSILFMPFHSFLGFFSSLLVLFILSWWVCLYPSTMASFYRHRRWLFFLGRFSSFPHCPWVWPLVRVAAYIQITFLGDYIVAIYPLGSLILDLSSAVATMLSMVNYLAYSPHLHTLFFLLAEPHLYPLFFPLVSHPSKVGKDQ